MKLPRTVRTAIGEATTHVPDLEELKALAVRAPSTALTAARHGVKLGNAGYAVIVKTAGMVTGRARQLVTDATALLTHPGASADRGMPPPAGPAADPWSGGPLQPVEDVRTVVSLATGDAAAVEAAPAGATLTHDDLPLADFDHLTLGELRARIRPLAIAELVQLREYERAHANRLPVMKTFDNRLVTLAKKPAAQEQVPAP